MWSFRRSGKEITTGVPIQNEQPMWLTWLLSAGTFLVTVLIVLGLFSAGRWALHRSSKKTTPPKVTTSQDGAGSSRDTPASPTTPQPSTPAAPTPTPPPAPVATPTPTPNLVNTGPTSDD